MRAAAIAAFAVGIGCSGEPTIEFGMDDAWPQPSLLPPPTGPRLAFTNAGDDTVSFVDLETLTPIARISVGLFPIEKEGPHHLVASPDGRFVYVGISNTVPLTASGPHGTHGAGTADGYLLKIDALTGREVARARVSQSPGDVRLDPNGRRIWQSHFNLAQVLQVAAAGGPREGFDSLLIATDAETMQRSAEVRVCASGHGIGFAPDASRIYVACYNSDQLAVVDAGDLTVTRVTIGRDPGGPPAPRYQPYALAVSPVSGRVWISAWGPGRRGFYVYDPAATTQALDNAAIPTDGQPGFGAFTADGARLFVVTQQPDRLLEIDPAVPEILREKDLSAIGCLNAHAAALSPDERSIWLVCEGDHARTPGTFEVLDRDALERSSSVVLGLYPDDIAVLPMPEPR